jgi:hypothetical protein
VGFGCRFGGGIGNCFRGPVLRVGLDGDIRSALAAVGVVAAGAAVVATGAVVATSAVGFTGGATVVAAAAGRGAIVSSAATAARGRSCDAGHVAAIDRGDELASHPEQRRREQGKRRPHPSPPFHGGSPVSVKRLSIAAAPAPPLASRGESSSPGLEPAAPCPR